MRHAIAALLVLFVTSTAGAEPGTTDAYQAATEWRDDITGTLGMLIFARGAEACGLRSAAWFDAANKTIRLQNAFRKVAYRNAVTNKPLFDHLADEIGAELNGEALAAQQQAGNAWRSPSTCLDVRQNGAMLHALDMDAPGIR